jgi:hypothetical protein
MIRIDANRAHLIALTPDAVVLSNEIWTLRVAGDSPRAAALAREAAAIPFTRPQLAETVERFLKELPAQ